MKLPINREWLEGYEGCGCCTSEFEDADAAIIINSVNNHHKLVELVKEARDLLLGYETNLTVARLNEALREAKNINKGD